ncbi:MFS general substrate transporter [Coniophora puteana RWD-64-598 SS2]|uniref:MFS general substrate transporter n=1 Tax=Coniophora puteana (strain RWD-64-598) TaxID=741705 RepID=A0A5M3MYL0_CONPW|nr:MFS general substrate transporter [Coniophora puteana RWD-64-598 SS2]EIW83691.1 MFS general substrate transporter [Coniophora puteana RWD-64-598 SS2]
MTVAIYTEDSALLPGKKAVTPLPKGQIGILLLAQIIEPFAALVIYPFINQLIGELNITGGDDRKIGYYAGLVESLFYVTQAMTVFQYSRLSDRFGRKPVLLLGIFGLALSMLCFGLSRTFWSLILSRCITGALNGNIGVMKSMLGELTDATNMAQGFALIPIAFSLGVTLGPIVGGSLARPQDQWPHIFAGKFWADYPYFLPCAISSGFAMIVFVLIVFFLKETVKKQSTAEKRRSWLLDSTAEYGAVDNAAQPLCSSPPPYSSNPEEPIPMRSLLTPPVFVCVANYGMLATLEIAYYSIQPLFYSTPLEFGGLDLSTRTIGLWMGLFGIANGLVQAFFFAPIVQWIGPKKLFCAAIVADVVIFTMYPIISVTAQREGVSPLVWAMMTVQLLLAVVQDMGYGCILMYITSVAPNKRCLGAVNGLAQTTASIARAIGPAVSTAAFAYSLDHNLLGGHAVYVIFTVIALFGVFLASRLPPSLHGSDKEESS